MNVSYYKKWFIVTAVIILATGLSTSVAVADGGTATLSDSTRSDSAQQVAYVQDVSQAPPTPFADPSPNALPEAAVLMDSGTASISGDGFVEEGSFASACDYDTCNKSYVVGSELKKFFKGCPQPTGVFVRTDYLLWWTKGGEVPPLITTSSDGDTGSGIIGSPYTHVLFGDKVLNFANRSGIRASGGVLFGCGRSIEFDYMTLGRPNNGRDYYSNGDYTYGNEFLARPFIDFATGQNAAQEIAGDRLRGRIRANQSEFFQSYGIFFRRPICCPRPTGCYDECCDETCDDVCGESCSQTVGSGLLRVFKPTAWQVDFLGGWRSYRLEEWTTIEENLVVKDVPPYIPGSTFDIRDEFATENVFNGAELGLSAKRCYGQWTFDFLAKVGLGSQTQIARINGQTILATPAGDRAVYRGGLLALISNDGQYRRNKFVAIPQIGGEVSYQMTKYLRGFVGYNVIYWPNVVRSGALIDMTVDQDQIPPQTGAGTRPAFSWNESDYWAQGMNFGLEARF